MGKVRSPFVADDSGAVQRTRGYLAPLDGDAASGAGQAAGAAGRGLSRRRAGGSRAVLATNILADYAADQPQVLADLLMDADEKQFAVIYPKFKEHGEQGLPVLTGEIDKKLPSDLPSSDEKQGEAGEAAGECGGGPAEDEPAGEGLAAAEAQPRSEGAELSDPSPGSAGCRCRGHRQAAGRGTGRDDSPGLDPESGGV